MKQRYLTHALESLAFADHKMAFVSGPRQCGKTTLARMLLSTRKVGLYRNWDETGFRRAWAKSPSSIIPAAPAPDVPLVVLDEIHKERHWKRNLIGVYDTLKTPCDLLVTGSARLNVYVRGSDSLMGRYLNFRLHPFSLREMVRSDSLPPDHLLHALASRALKPQAAAAAHLAALLVYGSFPEPLFKQNEKKARLWRRNREQLVIREDLRDLSHLPDLGQIEMLTALLPERVGSPFSVAGMREDLEVAFDTVRRWLNYLRQLYYIFEVKPYATKIPRSLRKEGKVYLWDYAAIKNEAARFENLVACHLLKACHFWTDCGEADFDLFYLRNKERQEIDFLITRDQKPWLPVEVKLAETMPSQNWKAFARVLPCKLGLQIVRQPEWRVHPYGDARILVAGAAEVLNYFV